MFQQQTTQQFFKIQPQQTSLPQGAITSGPNQNISVTPKQSPIVFQQPRLPVAAISSGPNQNISIAPRVVQQQISYSSTPQNIIRPIQIQTNNVPQYQKQDAINRKALENKVMYSDNNLPYKAYEGLYRGKYISPSGEVYIRTSNDKVVLQSVKDYYAPSSSELNRQDKYLLKHYYFNGPSLNFEIKFPLL
jgi:hypothetical protein